MKTIDAYHVTHKSNLNSILKNGLLPSIGKNSRSVMEHSFFTYFSTESCVDNWLKIFNLDNNNAVVLKFLCSNYIVRFGNSNDIFTSESFSADDIVVVDGGCETPLRDYCRDNKKLLDFFNQVELTKMLKIIEDRLKLIEKNSLSPEIGWDYNETEPSIIDIIDALVLFRSLDNNSLYVDTLVSIKKKVLEKLCANDLGIDCDSAIYRALEMVFDDSLSNSPKLGFQCLNVASVLLSIDLGYRQLDRYNRTLKKYKGTIWNYDRLDIFQIEEIINNNLYLVDLLDEVYCLSENNKKKYVKK